MKRAGVWGRWALWALWMGWHAGTAFAQTVPNFTDEERRWIALNPVVRYAADTRLHPLEYEQNGVYKGLIAEYLDAVARISGLRFELVPSADWPDAQQVFAQGRADLFPNVSPQRVSPEIGAQLRLTDPYFVAPTIIVTRTDAPVILNVKDLDGKVVAIRGGGSYARAFASRYPRVQTLEVSSPGDGLEAVVDGRAYATIGTDAVFMPMMRRQYVGRLSISGTIGEQVYNAQMGVRANQPLLYAVVAKSLGSLSAEETDTMNERWLEQTDFGKPSLLSLVEYRLPQILLLCVGIALLGWFAYRARVAQRAAQHSEQVKSRFLAVMSHEIRTPMNAVLASIEMLQRTPLDARQQRFAGTAATSAEALLSLLDDVLDLSKLDAKRLALERIPTDAGLLAQKVVDIARANAQGKAVSFALQLDNPGGQRVLIDPTRLRQVLLNLLGNAVKFTERGRIDVAVTLRALDAQQGTLSVAVADTGVGIPLARQAGIFEAYAQAEDSTTRRFGGTGLGLTICKELVELMGGQIRLRSHPGAGTTVSFELPVGLAPAVPQGAMPAADPVAPQAAPGTAARVLVVEDHPTNQFIIAEQLRTLGFEARIVASGADALAALQQASFALVLMDCHMPGMSGYDTTRRIRAQEAERGAGHLPILAVSAATDAAHLEKCMDSGMDGVLKKPLRLDELSSMLQLWLPVAAPSGGAPPSAPMPTAAELQRLYARTMAQDLGALRAALADGDLPRAAHHAHRMLGAARMTGDAAVATPVEALERFARGEATLGPDEVAQWLEALAQAVPDPAARATPG